MKPFKQPKPPKFKDATAGHHAALELCWAIDAFFTLNNNISVPIKNVVIQKRDALWAQIHAE